MNFEVRYFSNELVSLLGYELEYVTDCCVSLMFAVKQKDCSRFFFFFLNLVGCGGTLNWWALERMRRNFFRKNPIWNLARNTIVQALLKSSTLKSIKMELTYYGGNVSYCVLLKP